MSRKILIVEDEFIEANNLEMILEKAGYTVTGIARSVSDAKAEMAKETPDFVLIDIYLNGIETGIDLARELKKKDIPFLYLSANSNKNTLEAAKKTGPYGFLVKPYREKDVLVMLEIAVYQHLNRHNSLLQQAGKRALPENLDEQLSFKGIIGKSDALRKVIEQIRIVAPAETSVLILGESGTGKERAAEVIHELSSRCNGPLIKVNCAALPSTLIESALFGHERGAFTGALDRKIGKFEQANNGTIFLDEIGEMSPEMQVKLLRALQEHEIERLGSNTPVRINVRVIAATNRDLELELSEKRFRMDLYYRLHVFPIVMPPLRERAGDILHLTEYFIDHYCRKLGKPSKRATEAAIRELNDYNWPGNIRELEHLIERTVLLTREDVIDSFSLPAAKNKADSTSASFKTMAENERDHIIRVLKTCQGKVSGPGGAAEILGLPVSTLNARMRKLGIQHTRQGL